MHHEVHKDEFDIFVKETGNLLNAAKWAEALGKFHQINESRRRMAMIMVAEEVGLAAYTFCFYALSHELTAENKLFWHKMACSVVKSVLQNIKGREQAALFHAQAGFEIAPDDEEVLENLLSFYDSKLISEEEAQKIAEKVKLFSPNNAILAKLSK